MSDDIVVKIEGSEEPEAVVENTAATVIDAAVEIAELIVEAKEEGEASAVEVQQIKYSVDDIYGTVIVLGERIGVLMDLVMGISDQIAALATLEVAELIETESEETVEAVAETAEQIAPVIEEPVIAVEPEIRKSTKRNWI